MLTIPLIVFALYTIPSIAGEQVSAGYTNAKPFTSSYTTTYSSELNKSPVIVHATGAEAIRLRRRDNSDDYLDLKAGTGYKIGIIDSGVDYLHPDLGGCFGAGCKIAYGYDFVGDAYTGMNEPRPDADPMDECNGHGTHVAGIIGASSSIAPGVAPGATLGAYRVFGCQGSVAMEVLVAAMKRAASDGMDVINISIGTGRFFSSYPDAKTAQQLASQGVVIVASAGNDGILHMTGISSPSVAPDVFSVASVNPTKVAAYYYMLPGAASTERSYYLSSNHIAVPENAVNLVIRETKDPYGCKPLSKDYTNAFVFLIRGDCTFVEKALYAQQAGARGVIVQNKNSLLEAPEASDPRLTIPVLLIAKDTASKLVAAMQKSSPKDRTTVSWSSSPFMKVYTKSSFASVFSSFGPSDNATNIKPDLAADGMQIFSTYPRKLGSYAILTGTSMAAPRVSGLAAKALQKYAANIPMVQRPEAVRRAIVQSAATQYWPDWMSYSDENARRVLPTAYSGTGVARINVTNESGWGINPPSITFPGSTLAERRQSRTFTLQLTGDLPKGTVKFIHRPAASVSDWYNDTKTVDMTSSKSASVSFSPSSINIASSSTTNNNINAVRKESVKVTMSLSSWGALDDIWLVSGVLEAIHTDASTGRQMIRSIPYQVIAGTPEDLEILQTTNNYPRLENSDVTGLPVDSNNNKGNKNNSKHLVSFAKNATVSVRFRLRTPSPRLFAVVVDAKTNKQLGIVPNIQGNDLRQNADGVLDDYIAAWSGMIQPMPKFNQPRGSITLVPKGTYKLKLYVQRPYADPYDDTIYATWTSSATITVEDAFNPTASGSAASTGSANNYLGSIMTKNGSASSVSGHTA